MQNGAAYRLQSRPLDLVKNSTPITSICISSVGGQDKQQTVIAEDLIKRQEVIQDAVKQGAVILAICGGYQLLGHYYKPAEGEELKGLSILDAFTVAGNRRMIGNVIVKREDQTSLVGFRKSQWKNFLRKGRACTWQRYSGQWKQRRGTVWKGQQAVLFMELICMDRFYQKILTLQIV